MPNASSAPVRWWSSWWSTLFRLFSVDETPSLPALPLARSQRPPLERARVERPPPLPAEHVRICIDFGTSNSAIARAIFGAQPELATLQVDPKKKGTSRTIDSDVLWKLGRPTVLGAVARLLEKRRNEGEVHRSLKRMLADLKRQEDAQLRLRFRIEALMEELLLLSLCPEHAGTVVAQADLQGLVVSELSKEVGLPGLSVVAPAVARGTLDLYLCVPNAFGNFEEEVLRTSAQRAGESVQQKLANNPDHPSAVVVHLIREAEAAAWWALFERHLRHRSSEPLRAQWLVFDVGAGSTDAAVVALHADNDPGRSPEVRSILHSGASFGGHDLDELFLRLIAERAGDAAQIDKKLVDSGSTRALELRAIADAKECWSDDMRSALANWTAEQQLAWLEWIASPQGPMPGANELPALRPTSDVWPEVKEIPGSQWGEPYARFLRATGIGVVRALIAQSASCSLDLVLLSGRGSLLPGLTPLVTQELLKAGWIKNAEQVQPIAKASEDLKLACVLGIAVAASHAAIPERIPQRLTDDISLGRHTPLWTRGTRFVPPVLRAALRLGPHSGPRRLGFYQFRCPKEVAEAVGSSSLWEYRHLGSAELHVYTPVELAVQYDTHLGQLTVFQVDRENGSFPLTLETDPVVDTGINPVSGLPFGWVDA